jgi:hypothetical protein
VRNPLASTRLPPSRASEMGWLTDEYHSATVDERDVRKDAATRVTTVP